MFILALEVIGTLVSFAAKVGEAAEQMGLQHLTIQKKLTQVDIEEVGRLTSICNRFEGLDFLPPDSQMQAILYHEEGQLVGSLTIFTSWLGKAELTIIVHPKKRREGVGSTLLRKAKEECKRQGIERCLLICQESSKSGKAFVQSTRCQYQFSEYRMKLDRSCSISLTGQAVRMYQASLEDRKLLASIAAKSFGDLEDTHLQRYTEDIPKEAHRFYIAEVANQAIGSVGVVSFGDRVWIVALGVIPEYRRRGYGRQMLNRLVQGLLEENHQEILIEVATENQNALTLYRSCGFKEQAEYGYYAVPP